VVPHGKVPLYGSQIILRRIINLLGVVTLMDAVLA